MRAGGAGVHRQPPSKTGQEPRSAGQVTGLLPAEAARPTVQSSLPERKIPTANHPKFAALRIKSMGLMQISGGSGERGSSISKSPLGVSVTPAVPARLSVTGAGG